jgi:hypothetical protein
VYVRHIDDDTTRRSLPAIEHSQLPMLLDSAKGDTHGRDCSECVTVAVA